MQPMPPLTLIPKTMTTATAPQQWQPATGPAKSKVMTKTRQHVNALVVEDYRQICNEIEQAKKKLQDLLAAKVDLEMMAAVSNIILEPGDSGSE